MGDHEVCITGREEEEKEEGVRTAKVRDWHPTLIRAAFMVTLDGFILGDKSNTR